MKSVIKYFFVILISGVTYSCIGLTEEPFTFLAPENSYNSAEDLNALLLGVYSKFTGTFGSNPEGYYMKVEVLSEFGAPIATKGTPRDINIWLDVNNPSASMMINVFSSGYSIINSASLVLGRGESISMDETLKKQYYGEARFLRALTYFYLLRLYGGLPIPETYTSGLSGLRIRRKTIDETYDYIISELKMAEESLPTKTEYTGSNIWRASKGAVQALLGKVYLYRGSMQDNPLYFEESRKYSDLVITSKVYQLEPNFQDLWYWYNTENKNGMESIFELQFGHIGYIWNAYGESGNVANLMHIYTGASLPGDPNVGCVQYSRVGPTITAYNSYEEGDLRKEYTFLSEITLANDGRHLQWVEEDKGKTPGSKGWLVATPGNIKYWDRSTPSYSNELPAANMAILRYAEVLLNFAEAENEVNGPTTKAMDAINEVRGRANLLPLSGLSKTELSDAIYRERGWEFIGEGQLLYDGLRTNRIGDAVEAEIKYGLEHELYLYTGPLRYKPNKKFLMKIPLSDLDSNPELEQNPDN